MPRRGARRIDPEEVNQYLDSEDDLTLVLRGHACLEAVLNVVLDGAVPEDLNYLSDANLRFPARLDLAVLLGKVRHEDRRGWLILNGLRNDFAHDLDATIGDQPCERLLADVARPNFDRFAPPEAGDPERNREVVRWAIRILWARAANDYVNERRSGEAMATAMLPPLPNEVSGPPQTSEP
jgi:hypothetical protein